MSAEQLSFEGEVRLGDFLLQADLEIEPYKTTVLLGPNGAGKSTLVGAIAGMARLSAGRIALGASVFDEPEADIWLAPEKRLIGAVFQDLLLFDTLSARANVAFGLRARGTDRRAANSQADEMLARVGLEPPLTRRSPSQLSGGQAQAVALARTLIGAPRLLLLDEPFGSLDIELRQELRQRFAELIGDLSTPRLLVTHDATDAFLLADKIYVLEQGRITQAATPSELRRSPKTSYAASLAGTSPATENIA